MKQPTKKVKAPLSIEQKIKRRNLISFGAFFALGGGAVAGWRWLLHSPEETAGITDGAKQPLRRALNKTELFFFETSLATTTWLKPTTKNLQQKPFA